MRRALIIAIVLVAGCAGQLSQPTSGPSTKVPTLPPASATVPTQTETSPPAPPDDVPAIDAEAAAYPDDYCGKFFNGGFRPAIPSGALVSMWRANLAAHEQAIRAAAGNAVQLAFVGCTFSYSELLKVKDEVGSPEAQTWLKTIPAALETSGPDDVNNRVDVQISSAVADAPDRVLRHFSALYNLPPGILFVESDGTGQMLVPWGKIRITVVGPDGQPVYVPNALTIRWGEGPPNLACGGDRNLWGQDWRLVEQPTLLACQAGTWRISVNTSDSSPVLGSSTVMVEGDTTVDLTVKLSSVPP